MAAIQALDRSLDEFSALLDAKDKQEIPAKQQEALNFVGTIEESMVKGFPFEVPAQYASLPQLKVGDPPLACALYCFLCVVYLQHFGACSSCQDARTLHCLNITLVPFSHAMCTVSQGVRHAS